MSDQSEGRPTREHGGGAWRDSTYLGITRQRTVVGAAFLVALVTAIVLAMIVPEILLTSDEQRFALWVFNGFTGIVLFTLFLSVPLAVLYGLWNGGPVLAGAIPIVPLLVSLVVSVGSGTIPVTIDFAFALAGAGSATVVATVRTWMYAISSPPALSPASFASVLAAGVLLSTAATVLSMVSLWRVSQLPGPHLTTGRWLVGGLLVVAACGFLVLGFSGLFPDKVSRLQRKRDGP